MKYSNRNSLVLAIIFLIILISSGSSYYHFNKVYNSLLNENLQTQQNIDQMKSSFLDKNNSQRIENTLENLLYREKSNNKVVLKNEDSRLTYKYLTKLSKKFTPTMAFNFKLKNVNNNNNSKKVETGIYEISGSASTWNLFNFIYQIEFQAPMYILEEFTISEFKENRYDNKYRNYVNFRFILHGYSNNNGLDWNDIELKTNGIKVYKHNIFRTKLHAPRIIEAEEKYPHIENAQLLSITTDNAVIVVNNKVYTLSENDKVAYGRLKKIDWDRQEAIFTINRIGIREEKILKITGIFEEDNR